MSDRVDAADHAAGAAVDAARAAGVVIVEVHGIDDCAAAADVFEAVWGNGVEITAPLLRALAHGGNYVTLARAGDADGPVVGASMGFFAEPRRETLHSHITGVLGVGRGVGAALKLHQRAWAAQRGLTSITWTFDPLVARNARFNLCRLGVRVEEYLVNFYGHDPAISDDEDSDRLFVRWDVAPASTVRATLPVGTPTLTIAVPDELAVARAQRPRIREQFLTALGEGWRVAGFDERGYVLTREAQ